VLHFVHYAAIILASLVATGCGSREGPAAPVKLTILGLTLEAGEQLRRDAIDDFTRKTGIQVDVVPTFGTSSQQTALVLKLLNRRAASPDIYVVDVIWPGTLAEHLLDLTPYLNEEARTHLPALLKIGTVRERVVSLPFYMNAGVLYYRDDLLKAYGYTAPPKTWEELRQMALQIQQSERRKGRKGFWGYVWQGAAYEGLTCNALEWQASFGGGHIIENDGAISVNNAATVRAMKTATAWIGSISPMSVLSYTETDTQNVFRSRNAAFMRYWTSGFRAIVSGMPAGFAGVAPLPSGPGGRAQTLGGFSLAVSRYSSHVKDAAALVLYLTSAEVQTRRAIARGFLPTYAHVYQRPDLARALPEARSLFEASTRGSVLRPSSICGKNYGQVSRAYYETVHAILSRKVRPESALPDLQTRLASLLNTESARQD